MSDLLQLVTFTLNQEEYAVDIRYVQEINKLSDTDITALPNAPRYVKGVTNLRGKVIPVISMNTYLSLPDCSNGCQKKIMVVNVNDKTIGLIVDGVSEVLRIDSSLIEPVPAVAETRSGYLQGIVKLENKLITLIDIEKLGLS